MKDDLWMSPVRAWRAIGTAAAAIVRAAGSATAQDRTLPDDEWCDGHDRKDGVSICEVREWTMRAPGSVSVNAKPNGGISVESWDRGEMQVRAKVHTWAESEAEARDLVGRIEVKAGGSISAEGPKTDDDEGWSVSYRVMIPRDTDLDLASTNGGITIQGVKGVQRDGKGLAVRTTNGGVTLSVPSGYSAHLEAATTNGGMNIGFPVTVQGKIDRKLSVDLGEGGPTVKVTTTNGGVRITEN
jgi:hypothetical protein